MNILIGAHYNLNNGDRAVLESTIQLLYNQYPNANIIVSAYKPELLQDKRFYTVPWPLGSKIKERCLLYLSRFGVCRSLYRKYFRCIVDTQYYKALESADLVLMSGGHHLTDILGNIGYYKLALNFIPPIAFGKKIILLPQSIGPASNVSIRKSISNILTHTKAIAYRDEASSDFINSLNCKCNMHFVPDVVFYLNIPQKQKRNKEVGIALYHVYNSENREKMLSITMKGLSAIINDLLSQEYKVKIIPMDKGDFEFYKRLFESVKNNKNCKKFVMCLEKNNILDLISEFSGLDFVLAYKTHATVFSMICNTPLLTIAYHPKAIEFMESVGLKEYSIMDNDANYENMKRLVSSVQNNLEKIREIEQVGVIKNRVKIMKFFKEIEDGYC